MADSAPALDVAPVSTAPAPVAEVIVADPASPVEAAPAKADGTPAEGVHVDEPKSETKAEARIRKMQLQAQRAREDANAKLAEAQKLVESNKQADQIKQILLTSKAPKKDLAAIGVDIVDLFQRHSYEEIGGEPAPSAEDRLKALEDERAKERDAAIVAAITAQKAEVAKLLGSSETVADSEETYADKFELVNAYGRSADVYELAANYCSKYPGITAEQADAAIIYFASQIENDLENEVVEKAAKTKKFAKKFAAPRESQNPALSQSPVKAAPADQPNGNKKPNTLHPGLGRATPTTPSKGPMDERARIKWAMAQTRQTT